MKLFLDSAKIDEIVYAIEKWGIEGVTSNPRHIKNSGKSMEYFMNEAKKVVENTNITVSVEVNPHLNKAEEIAEEAKRIASISENFVVKIPATEEGLYAVKLLNNTSVKVNVTLVFNPVQALQAARMGAYYISPFVGWREERGENNINYVSDIVNAVHNYGFKSQVLIAAIRNAKQIIEAINAKADILTAGFDVYKNGFDTPYTKMGLDIFSQAWDEIKKQEG